MQIGVGRMLTVCRASPRAPACRESHSLAMPVSQMGKPRHSCSAWPWEAHSK